MSSYPTTHFFELKQRIGFIEVSHGNYESIRMARLIKIPLNNPFTLIWELYLTQMLTKSAKI